MHIRREGLGMRARLHRGVGPPGARVRRLLVALSLLCNSRHLLPAFASAALFVPHGLPVRQRLQPVRGRGRTSCVHRLAASEAQSAAWGVLGLAPGARKEEIRIKYRKLVATEHPDKRPGDAEAARRFTTITAAYQELTADPPVSTGTPASANSQDDDNESDEDTVSWADLLKASGFTEKDVRNSLFTTSALGFAAVVLLLLATVVLDISPDSILSRFLPDPSGGLSSPEGVDAASMEAGKAFMEQLGLSTDPETLSRQMENPSLP
mmetsp:Transcript_104691/g.223800  ORF Transcript_104691/g.223800 Transcript_104691/m.223800 type:complete len:266 (+) Transcript_104691:44-841(+)